MENRSEDVVLFDPKTLAARKKFGKFSSWDDWARFWHDHAQKHHALAAGTIRCLFESCEIDDPRPVEFLCSVVLDPNEILLQEDARDGGDYDREREEIKVKAAEALVIGLFRYTLPDGRFMRTVTKDVGIVKLVLRALGESEFHYGEPFTRKESFRETVKHFLWLLSNTMRSNKDDIRHPGARLRIALNIERVAFVKVMLGFGLVSDLGRGVIAPPHSQDVDRWTRETEKDLAALFSIATEGTDGRLADIQQALFSQDYLKQEAARHYFFIKAAYDTGGWITPKK